MSLCFEQRLLDLDQVAVQAPLARQDAPPRKIGNAAQDVRHGLTAPGAAQFDGQFAERHEVTGFECRDGLDDRLLELGRLAIERPRRSIGVRRVSDHTRPVPAVS